ncbi:hypothetical protein [Paenibacillus glacialis]|uniref:hypothetical protein n=1 Tax=Paenibacillus glacialis TaxID=494026 RepID=UPI001B8003FA|nr:hypothetical protein [Paenibacillus glacialis]
MSLWEDILRSGGREQSFTHLETSSSHVHVKKCRRSGSEFTLLTMPINEEGQAEAVNQEVGFFLVLLR